MGGGLHAVQTVVLLLLVLVAGFAVMARRWNVPYPIVLVLAGLGISFVPHIPRVPLDPNLVFLIFLPPLLYGSAWTTSLRELRRNSVVIGLLAFGLVGFTVWGVAEFSDHFITALDWKAGFLLGAVVSTTDAIAASSIAKTLGLPRRIVDILEGESLLNDASGLLALELGIGIIVHGETPTIAGGLTHLAVLVCGGVAIGLLIGAVVLWLEQFIEDGPIELVVSLVVPYLAYLVGERAGVSGVLAVVTCGLFLSRKSVEFLSSTARLQVFGAWDALIFALNGLVFVLIGLQLPYVLAGIRGKYSLGTLVLYGAVFSVVLIVLRMVWVFPALRLGALLERRCLGHKEQPVPWKGSFVIGWTGMRGVIALAAAISLPEALASGEPFGPRNLIVFLSFCVILVTLVLQGMTLPMLIRALGLTGPVGIEPEEIKARRQALIAAIAELEEGRRSDPPEYGHVYEDMLHKYEHRLAAVNGKAGNTDGADWKTLARLRAVQQGAIRTERRTLIRLRDAGQISDDVLRTLERELDLEESREEAREGQQAR